MEKRPFSELGLNPELLRAVDKLGFEEASPIQTAVIPVALTGRDLVGQSATGSGKTAAFGLPAISCVDVQRKEVQVLVLCPTRELAVQVAEEIGRLAAFSRGLHAVPIYGGQSYERQFRALAAGVQIVIGTPGRILDHMERGTLHLDKVRMVVLDEADRMLDMGFRPAVDRIVAKCPKDRQTLFFSATLDGDAGVIAQRYTRDAVRHEHQPPARKAPAIEHRFVRAERDERLDHLVREIGGGGDLNLVFVRTKHGADRLVRHLKKRQVQAVAMHGDKSQRQRERALADFEAGRVTTLVATDVAARGIHVDNVAKVINFDPPGMAEDYVHRAGRTGRAGERGVAVTFVGEEHIDDMRTMTRVLKLESQFSEAAGPAAQKKQPQAQRGGNAAPRQGRRPARSGQDRPGGGGPGGGGPKGPRRRPRTG
jgi:ATP-dependent RNA helicase DeaD